MGVSGAARRPKLRWGRVLAALLVLLVGTLGVRHSLGVALAGRSTDFALRVDSENALVRAQAAMKLVQARPDPGTRARARVLARQALARDASNVTALAALGLASDTPALAAAAFTVSDRLSRRDLVTRLWMIENSVAKGDVDTALRHYDIALRTSRNAPSILFPVLVNATADEALLPAITRTLLQQPLWGGLYLQQLAQSGQDRPRIATLFAMLKRRGAPTGAAADATLYARLMEARLVEDAWKVYAAGQAGARRNGLRNGNFADQPASPTPFDWQVSDNEFVTARLERLSSGQGRLAFTTSAGEGGEVARQLLLLPPGSHGIAVDVERIELAEAPAPELRVTCLASGAELSRAPLRSQGTSVVRFTVPAGCTAQNVSIVIRAGASLGTVDGALRTIRLTRAG